MFFRLWNFIFGYVIILVEGFFCEKFINIASKRHIKIWNVKRDDNKKLFLRVGIKSFRRLRPVALKSRCRVRIIKKVGLPFFIRKYRKRKAFVIGLILCILMIWGMSSIVWTVEINGDPTLSISEVSDLVRSMGVYPGVMKGSVDREKISRAIIKEMKDIGWAGVSLKGTKLTINLAKRDPLPKIVPTSLPCDVVAAKEGIVKQVIALKGMDMVKPGDTVVKGQILIAGSFVPRFNEEVEVQVHATGQVIASTWYEEVRKVELKEVERYRTGRKMSNASIQIFGININIFPKKADYTLYDTITESKNISIAKLILPISFSKETFYENDVNVKDIDVEEAKENAVFEAHKACLDKIPDEATIVNKKIEFIPIDNGGLAAKVTIECEENIGIEVGLGE